MYIWHSAVSQAALSRRSLEGLWGRLVGNPLFFFRLRFSPDDDDDDDGAEEAREKRSALLLPEDIVYADSLRPLRASLELLGPGRDLGHCKQSFTCVSPAPRGNLYFGNLNFPSCVRGDFSWKYL